MALDESTDGLEKMESNGINAFIDPKLNEYIAKIGDIKIDFINNEHGAGYTIKVGEVDCSKGGCSC